MEWRRAGGRIPYSILYYSRDSETRERSYDILYVEKGETSMGSRLHDYLRIPEKAVFVDRGGVVVTETD